MAADTPYVGTEAAGALAAQVKKRLLVADTMPASPAEGQVVLYAGATTANFTQGGIYLYDGEAWSLISAADIDLSAYKKQYNMTTAEWEALTEAEKVALAGQNVVISDDEGTQTFDDIIPSNASSTNKLATASDISAVTAQLSGNYIIQRTRLDSLSDDGTGTLTGEGFTRAYGEDSDPADITLSQSILNFDEIEIECIDSVYYTLSRVQNYTSLARTIIKLLPKVAQLAWGYDKRTARTIRTNSSGDITTVAVNEYRMSFTANNILSVNPMIYGKSDSDSEDSYIPQLSAVFKVWGIKHIEIE